jgi:single-strand DNA-binding protein
MKNDLNSFLVEGTLVGDPEMSHTYEMTPVCYFTIRSIRQWMVEEEIEKEVYLFDVELKGKLAETCGEYLKKGRGVRVVGRLKSIGTVILRETFIVGEHVEFKPEGKKK